MPNAVVVLTLVSLTAHVSAAPDKLQGADPLLGFRTSGKVQGMFEVREEARKFLARQTPPPVGVWVASIPDVRIFVPTCALPFKTRWAAESDQEAAMPGVMVICPKSTDKAYRTWDAFVPVHAVRKSASRK